MKNIISGIITVFVVAGMAFLPVSCKDGLLDQPPTQELGSAAFWQTEADATYALMGAYASLRPIFDREYHWDGLAEYLRVYNTGVAPISFTVSNPSNFGGGADAVWQACYGGVSRANYVIHNVSRMLPNATAISKPSLEAIVAEARLLRGMVYFRLIAMYGDVPYFGNIINDNSEVASLERLPIKQVKDSILADFNYAAEKLPDKSTTVGRAAKPAALAFRGKLNLYWACWNKFGWPELETFTPSETEANAAYATAANDFKRVITEFNLGLFRNGDPGNWGTMGNAEILPNYYYLFIPSTGNANAEGEMIMVFTHGGTGSGQSEELMRVFTGRTVEGSQNQVIPRYEIADRYQSTITGDFCEPLIPMNPNTNPNARKTLNSAVNPQSYADRDYRMKGTLLWDYEMIMGITSLKETGYSPFIYKKWNASETINGVKYTTFNDGGTNRTGYDFRKFVRNYAGQGRSEGDYNWPVMRLPDVYLMYAEATNAINGPQADAIELVNKIRYRGNLPALKPEKTATKEAFFDAIEQERIIELFAEGQRGWDLRRWRALERVWGPPYGEGKWTIDTWGDKQQQFFFNASELTYQRCYIFRIPESERERNPNLTQNAPWR